MITIGNSTAGGGLEGCRDVVGWRNSLGASCATYTTLGWCKDGKLTNASAGNSLFGWPQRACCVCGKKPTPPPATARVEQMFFFATHEIDDVDKVILRHYNRDVGTQSHVGLFVMLFANATHERVRYEQRRQAHHGAPVFMWAERDVARVFPRIATSITTHKGLKDTRDPNHQRYFWFHSSLLIWNATYGHAYPNLEFFWRIEPDVLVSGPSPLTTLVAQTLKSRRHFDVLLPTLTRREDDDYDHFRRNEGVLRGLPYEQQVWALVSVGRYSRWFLNDVMRPKWQQGIIGYEEVFLPNSCNLEEECELAPFNFRAKIKVLHVRFRPVYPCEQFLAAHSEQTYELWHPVKNRTCYAERLQHEEKHHPPPARR